MSGAAPVLVSSRRFAAMLASSLFQEVSNDLAPSRWGAMPCAIGTEPAHPSGHHVLADGQLRTKARYRL